MVPTTLKELGWLHDSVVLSVSYDASQAAGRLVKLAIRCHPDCGHAPWAGKNLSIAAVNVAVLKHVLWGWVTEPETIDSIRPGVSRAVEESTVESKRMGLLFPDLAFTVIFHSGSFLEVICQTLQVDIES